MQSLVTHALDAHDPDEAFRHVKRAGTLSRRQLAVCREVAAWRERKASKRDVPRKWLLSDEVVIELSKRAPRTIDRLRRVRGTAQLAEKDAEAVLLAVKRGLACPADRLPEMPRRHRPSAETEGVVDLMSAMVRIVSERTGIAAPVIAGRDDLLDLLSGREGRLSRGWRRELMGSLLGRLLAGEAGLTVKDGRVEIL